jgi:hypothetical protein
MALGSLAGGFLGDFQIGFTGTYQISDIIWADDVSILNAKLSVTLDSGSPILYLGISDTWNGVYIYEEITNDVTHVFTATGKFLKWKIIGSCVVSYIEAQVNL